MKNGLFGFGLLGSREKIEPTHGDIVKSAKSVEALRFDTSSRELTVSKLGTGYEVWEDVKQVYSCEYREAYPVALFGYSSTGWDLEFDIAELSDINGEVVVIGHKHGNKLSVEIKMTERDRHG